MKWRTLFRRKKRKTGRYSVTMKVTVSDIVIECWADQWWYEDPGDAKRPNKWKAAKTHEEAFQKAQELQRRPATLLMELTD